ncbi:uncharacterized protein K452DRAFT_283224 [Aplosporella prunicola CBS 121167]|uniref:WLM domain-containing protein n=1 Tax=Aplosporella prunicola CBS 121167 TaxID=1176127 RepID=A0A6A6BR60_9PEZI|nr:uncharacterized protein K452DRAFT_283224 [Aplosporella prunicola CBS 121167]KAF2145933.1 hypothetical protein K452DRAFT_283224 [Aplosporella prunicola CBS 121167]
MTMAPTAETKDANHESLSNNNNNTSTNTMDGDTSTTDTTDTLTLTLTHHGTRHAITLPSSATISDLSTFIETDLHIPPSHQKLLISPKPGLQRPPFKDPTLLLLPLASRKFQLIGSTPSEIATLQTRVSHSAAQHAARTARNYAVAPAVPARTAGRGVRGSALAAADAAYTFHVLRPLPHLPAPERSLRFLERLRDDAGVRAAMRAHRFSVPLLTEMDPAAHTTHEGRTLGLNRNRGEVIELRLRTDAGDGYRDYKTIRRTLCHELAHNVWGDHDRNFWALCRQIEGEVERADWTRGGRAVGDASGGAAAEAYIPPEQRNDVFDHGAWTGGEFVLGSGSGSGNGGGNVSPARGPLEGSSGHVQLANPALSRREVLARAADERARRTRQADVEGEDGSADGSASGSGREDGADDDRGSG